jgi:hypothetical protein
VVDADDVRRVGSALPRTYEAHIRGRWKLKVKQLVYVAFSRDETAMGFGFPREQREGLVESDPDTFFLPATSDLRYQWVCARLSGLDQDEMRELVTDAWRLCVPKMLHDLPDLPDPVARLWGLVEQQEWGEVRPLLHPYVRFRDGEHEVRGRGQLLAHLRGHPTPKPPRAVELRDGQVYRWERSG